jgi:hypothetical protein
VVEAAWRYALAFADLDDPNHPYGAVVAVDTAREALEQAVLQLRELRPLDRTTHRPVRPSPETVRLTLASFTTTGGSTTTAGSESVSLAEVVVRLQERTGCSRATAYRAAHDALEADSISPVSDSGGGPVGGSPHTAQQSGARTDPVRSWSFAIQESGVTRARIAPDGRRGGSSGAHRSWGSPMTRGVGPRLAAWLRPLGSRPGSPHWMAL